jgi:hypothetical protein
MQFARAQVLVKSSIDSDGSTTVNIPAPLFRELLIKALRAKGMFDADFYLVAYPDVRRAIDQRQVDSADDHYYHTGYFESRLPQKILVDEKFYLRNNPDVESAIRQGTVKSAQEHFETAGFEEGRLPYADFSLF